MGDCMEPTREQFHHLQSQIAHLKEHNQILEKRVQSLSKESAGYRRDDEHVLQSEILQLKDRNNHLEEHVEMLTQELNQLRLEAARSSKEGKGGEEFQIKPLVHPSLKDWRTSLADIHRLFGASFVVASAPEWGMDSEKCFKGIHPGNQCGAPVMQIFETLPTSLKDNVVFANLVDFAGSTSERFCKSRIRHLDDSKKIVWCEGDFERDLCEAFPLDCEVWDEHLKKKRAIEHSAWLTFWRGKVCGGMTSTLISSKGHPTEDLQTQVDAEGPVFKINHVRLLVVITVDGGPVTQVEKSLIPDIARDVMQDINRRKYEWALQVQVVWVHFPSIVDVLHSFDGLRNLAPDFDASRIFSDDYQSKGTTTYRCVAAEERPCRRGPESLLQKTVEDICQSASAVEVTPEGFRSAAYSGELATIEFVLKKSPELLDVSGAPGFTALMNAAMQGHTDVVEALLGRRADISKKAIREGSKGLTALSLATMMKRSGAVKVLLGHKADPNWPFSSYSEGTVLQLAQEEADKLDLDVNAWMEKNSRESPVGYLYWFVERYEQERAAAWDVLELLKRH